MSIPTTQQAMRIVGPCRAEFHEVPVPQPQPGQVLVRGRRSLISTGTELTCYSGDFPPDSAWANWVHYPFATGYSYVGTVAAVGEGVQAFNVGDRVVGHGYHQPWAALWAARTLRLPEGVADDAATFGILGEIAMGGVRIAGLTLGESAAVIGLGLVGQLAAQLARLNGARPVIAIDPMAERRKLARDLGAHLAPEDDGATGEALIDAVRGAGRWQQIGGGVDVAFDVSGHPSTMPLACRLARKLGRVVLLGSPRGPVTMDFHDEVHREGLKILGAHTELHPKVEDANQPWTQLQDRRLFLELVAAGELRVDALTSHTFAGADAPGVFAWLWEHRAEAMGVILTWDD